MFVDFLQTLFLFYKTKTFSRNIDKNEEGCYTNKEKGMRRSKTAGGTETSYVYEKGKLIREIRGSEKIDYLYGEDGIIGIKIGSEKYLYRKNVFGDVTEIYDEAGTLVGKYNYNAFGECEIETDEGGIAEKNPIRYRGYYYDEETGFYYLKTRYYDPEIGRFITIDDTSYLDADGINGLNLYAYCGNNPVMNVDPEGTSWWSNLWNGIGNFFNTIGRGFTKIFSGIGNFFGSLVNYNNDFGFDFDIGLDFEQKSLFERFIENFSNNIKKKITGFKNFFEDVAHWIKENIDDIYLLAGSVISVGGVVALFIPGLQTVGEFLTIAGLKLTWEQIKRRYGIRKWKNY